MGFEGLDSRLSTLTKEDTMYVSRHGFWLGIAGMALAALVLSACAPEATPTPTPIPKAPAAATPTAAPAAKPTAAAPAATPTAAPASKPAAAPLKIKFGSPLATSDAGVYIAKERGISSSRAWMWR